MPSENYDGRSSEAAKQAIDALSSSAKQPLLQQQKSRPKQGITFAAQDKLPKLPIPELDGSLKKFLEALRPLQSPKEASDSKIAIDEFLKKDGPELQEKLHKYAAGKANYIEQFCKLA